MHACVPDEHDLSDYVMDTIRKDNFLGWPIYGSVA